MAQLMYALRRPRFPIICDVSGELVAAKTGQEFQRRIAKLELPAGRSFKIVAGTGTGWVFLPEMNVIAPAFVDRIWTKKRIVEMFNTSVNAQRAGIQYLPGSLNNRRLDVVAREVADLLSGIAKHGGSQPEARLFAEPAAAADRGESGISAGRRGG